MNTDHGVELHFTCRGCGARGVIGGATRSADVVPLPAVPGPGYARTAVA